MSVFYKFILQEDLDKAKDIRNRMSDQELNEFIKEIQAELFERNLNGMGGFFPFVVKETGEIINDKVLCELSYRILVQRSLKEEQNY